MTLSIAHDYITQRGGAERVVLAMARSFRPTELITSVYEKAQTFDEFMELPIRTSLLQNVPAFRRDPRRSFPLLATTWRTTKSSAQLTLVSSSGWAHRIATTEGYKVVYCHNPPRWLYQPEDYFGSPLIRSAASPIMKGLVGSDRRSAADADLYIANSSAVARRIFEAYRIRAEIIFPPVSIDPDGVQEPLSLEPGFWLTVGRRRGYKNTSAVLSAMQISYSKDRLVVVGDRPASFDDLPNNIFFTGSVSDSQLRWLYANARGLISVSREDFGLTPIEANAFGTPSLLLRAGGFLDSLDEGVTGRFVEDDSASSIARGMRDFGDYDPLAIKAHASKFSEFEFAASIRRLLSNYLGVHGV